jgi:hypothetical protein
MFLVILPEHAFHEHADFEDYWLALEALRKRRVDLDAVWKVLMRVGLAALDADLLRENAETSRHYEELRTRAARTLTEARRLVAACHESQSGGLRADPDSVAQFIVKYGDEAVAHLDAAIADVTVRLLPPLRGPASELHDKSSWAGNNPGFTQPSHSARSGRWPKPWVEQDGPRLLRDVGVPVRLIDDLLYPFRTPRRFRPRTPRPLRRK